MLPLFGKVAEKVDLKGILKDIEEFKGWRNALAHGLAEDLTGHPEPVIRVGIISRSGKPKVVEITPDNHRKRMDKAEQLLKRISKARLELKNEI